MMPAAAPDPAPPMTASTDAYPCFFGWVTHLVRTHRPRLIAAARGEGLTDAEALDAVQEALVTFLGRDDATALVAREDESARLLVAIVRNAARNQRKRHHRARPHERDPDVVQALPADADSVDALIARAEEQVALTGCVAQLGRLQREVVTLRLLEELTSDEVAAQLGTTPGNVAVMLHRAKQKLRACLLEGGSF
jgi:RNA polymerase sigma-70 factor, ECF subfamily